MSYEKIEFYEKWYNDIKNSKNERDIETRIFIEQKVEANGYAFNYNRSNKKFFLQKVY